MSRRKQLRPKPIKDDDQESNSSQTMENEPVKKRRCTAMITVKNEPEDLLSDNSDDLHSRNSFACQLCPEVFSSISNLQQHTIQHHTPSNHTNSHQQTSPVECQQCSEVLPSFSAFIQHMRLHLTEPARPKCNICHKTFNNQEQRQTHLMAHFETEGTRRICTDCGVEVPTMFAYTQHCTEAHLSIQYVCTICAHISTNQKEFREHSMDHSKESKCVECVACRIAFENKDLLYIHVQLVHDKDECVNGFVPAVFPSNEHVKENGQRRPTPRPLQCSVCDEQCMGEDALDEHRLFSHCKVPYSDCCAECAAPLRTQEEFELHTRLHTRDMYMHCPVCRQSLRSEAQLQLHCRFHMAERAPSDREEQHCNICSKTLVSREQLNVHLLEHDAMRSCPHCQETFQLAHQLILHVDTHHAKETPQHTCEICGAQFRFSIQFEHHKMEHLAKEEEKSSSCPASPSTTPPCFVCPLCNKNFTSLSALQTHNASHRESSTMRCPVCTLSFNTISRFENHVRKHANTSNCMCQICGDGFTSREDLDSHMGIHKGNLSLAAH